LCIHVQAVSYDFKPRTRCNPNAETPFFCAVMNQAAANHVNNGVRVRSKRVPAVTDVCLAHDAHMNRPEPVLHASRDPHRGQQKPSGHRNPTR
jgi:hypothetical protein